MRAFVILTALSASASAQLMSSADLASIPAPQLETVPVGSGSQGAVANTKRSLLPRTVQDCGPLPLGSGPTPSPDTDTAFLADQDISNTALNAVTPNGWTQVFQNQQSATSSSAYMGYNSYTSYDPSQCAADCLNNNGCMAFNIFFERDPTLQPAANCSNPPSTTVIKCSYWGVGIGPATLTNNGQYMNDFHVVNAGSNGYQLTQPTFNLPGYNSTWTNNATINAPTSCNSYITYVAHENQPYDPSLCASDCAAQRQEQNPWQGLTCRFFTSYLLLKNGVVQSQICALYSRTWDSSYATNTGYFSGSDVYTIQDAYSWTYSADIGTFTCPQGNSSSTTTSCTTSSITTASPSTASTSSSTVSTTTQASTSTTSSSTSSTSQVSSTTTVVSTSSTSQATSSTTTVPSTSSSSSSSTTITTTSQRTSTTTSSSTSSTTQAPSTTVPTTLSTVKTSTTTSCSTKTTTTTTPCTTRATTTSTTTSCTGKSPSTTSTQPKSTPLTSCPQPLQYIITSDHSLYAVCTDTDYQIPSPQIYYNIPDNRSCGAKCSSTSSCLKAVYNPSTQTCYLKGSPSVSDSNWRSNSGFQTLERVADGTPLGSQCLAPWYSVQRNGKTWWSCPSSTLGNCPTRNTWTGVSSEYDCAARCQAVGSKVFVFNFNTNTCYDKGNPSSGSGVSWSVNSSYNVYFAQ